MRTQDYPLAPVLRGEGWGEGSVSKGERTSIRRRPLTPTLSPAYGGEGAMHALPKRTQTESRRNWRGGLCTTMHQNAPLAANVSTSGWAKRTHRFIAKLSVFKNFGQILLAHRVVAEQRGKCPRRCRRRSGRRGSEHYRTRRWREGFAEAGGEDREIGRVHD